MTDFVFFWHPHRKRLGDKAVFSQWYQEPFHSDGLWFPTAEHWMMYEKARLFEDFDTAARILDTPTPGDVKELGRQVQGFTEQIWDENKYHIVKLGNLLKFSQSSELERILLDTGDAILVEASPYDRIWGIGMKEDHRNATKPELWKGQNLLGRALMDVRAMLIGG